MMRRAKETPDWVAGAFLRHMALLEIRAMAGRRKALPVWADEDYVACIRWLANLCDNMPFAPQSRPWWPRRADHRLYQRPLSIRQVARIRASFHARQDTIDAASGPPTSAGVPRSSDPEPSRMGLNVLSGPCGAAVTATATDGCHVGDQRDDDEKNAEAKQEFRGICDTGEEDRDECEGENNPCSSDGIH
ncbi:hypothetical protein [Streptacidiphilus monticola]|uniref:Uncharacterized protein n=1 Tax=Streptacidiphilus monticola TaxID=2161674 RepID=A0ABW1FW41_9ACTN